MSEGISEAPPNIYIGLNEQHNKKWIEEGWKAQSAPEFPEKIQELNVDEVISGLVSESILEGKKDVTVLDLGSGSEGFFIKSFLKKEDFPKLHDLLEKNSGIKLHVIGITGVENERRQGEIISQDKIEIGSEEKEKNQIQVENYAYTVTQSSTLDRFLKDKNITQIDASFSTFGIGYFTPNNFEKCLVDISNYLVPGGRFYGISWDAVPAGAIRSPLGGIFMMRADLKIDHPFNKVFGGFSNNREYERFYSQSPEDQVDAHLKAVDSALSRGLVSLEQVREIISGKNSIFPIPAFVRSFHLYTTSKEQSEVLKFIKRYEKGNPWVNQLNWNGSEDLIDTISRAKRSNFRDAQNVAKANLFSKIKLPWVREKTFYEREQQVQDATWQYIEKRYANKEKTRVDKEKQTFDLEISNLDWAGIKEKIKSLDAKTIARFWNWDRMMYKLQQVFIERQARKTTNFKQMAINKLAQREDLQVFSSAVNGGGHGLNVFIEKMAT